ncbi:MAG: PRC-barrel domain-containing protein [Chloroflexota bacterium]|nr:PRC-barrel domain-containing protein [Chloroflexota bacterium]
MEVLTSDGTSLGKVTEVYFGTEPANSFETCDDETSVEVHRGGLFGKGVTMYVPCRAVAGVSGDTVTLNVDAETATAKGWARKPSWIGS